MSGRTELARAIGRCEAGQRTIAVVPGDELLGALDLVRQAALRLLPLVVRVPLTGSHLAYHAAADTGAVLWMARDPDELADLELVAQLLAERALVPVLLAHESPEGRPAEAPPPSRAAQELLGEAAAMVAPSTPAQEMLFGRHRRRVPRWFDLERPVLRGQDGEPGQRDLRDPRDLRDLRRAGWASMFQAPVPQLLATAQRHVEQATGRSLALDFVKPAGRADVLVVAQGGAVRVAEALAAEGGRPRIGVLALCCLRPFPDRLAEALKGRRPVVVVERADAPLAGTPPLLREIQSALLSLPDKQRPGLHSALHGLGGVPLQVEDLRAFCAEVPGKGRAQVYLGVDFAPAGGAGGFPKRQVLLEELQRAYPGLDNLGLKATPPRTPVAPAPKPTPAHRRLLPHPQPTHDSAARFWDLMGAPLGAGAKQELTPDPYLTAGSVPAWTSPFHAVTPGSELPAWQPALCTGCGQCWTACPDGAILPVVLPPAALLETGMQRARVRGHQVDALGRLAGRLAKGLSGAVSGGVHNGGEALRATAAPLLEKMADDDRGTATRAACTAVAEALDPVAVAVTAPFADNLLALAVDPDACKGCQLCVAECQPDALLAEARTEERDRVGREAAALWHELPDTPGAVIAGLRDLPEPGCAAALSLSRHCLHAMAPGDEAEAGSGQKVALRQVLAATEAHLQPRLQPHLQDIAELQERFAEEIRTTLSSALPTGDLDALSEGLATLERGDLELSTLASSLSEVTEAGRVDSNILVRLVETARALADLHWRVREGTSGLGRARAGIAVAAGSVTEWADAFPWNPFTAPVSVAGTGDGGDLALGLLQGQLQALCEDFALLRRARALLDKTRPGPRQLSWNDLTDAEQRLCPPLWLVGDGDLGRAGLAQVSALLCSGLPVKVLVLTDLDSETQGPDLGLLALAHREAFVLQSSVGYRDHLAEGTLRALRFEGPALLHVHAPSPARQEFAAEELFERTRQAVASRTWPLFCYDPTVEGVFGLRLSLAGNPEDNGVPECAGHRLQVWQTLQELAGRSTPFTEQVREEAAASVAEAHQQELARLHDQHDARLGALRSEVEHEMVQRLQRKLAALAGGWRP